MIFISIPKLCSQTVDVVKLCMHRSTLVDLVDRGFDLVDLKVDLVDRRLVFDFGHPDPAQALKSIVSQLGCICGFPTDCLRDRGCPFGKSETGVVVWLVRWESFES